MERRYSSSEDDDDDDDVDDDNMDESITDCTLLRPDRKYAERGYRSCRRQSGPATSSLSTSS